MKKHIFHSLLLAALTLAVGSCGSDSDDSPAPDDTPAPATLPSLIPGNDARPTTWVSPDASLFELHMAVQVQLGDTLAAYQSDADLMCATIDGEVRAATAPLRTGYDIYYPLIIFNNADDSSVSLSYYCDRLHRIYTISGWAIFNAAAPPMGVSSLYRPCFAGL